MELLACAPKWQSNGVILAGSVESPDPNLAGAPSLPANKKTGRGPQPVLIRASPRCNRLQISFGTITTVYVTSSPEIKPVHFPTSGLVSHPLNHRSFPREHAGVSFTCIFPHPADFLVGFLPEPGYNLHAQDQHSRPHPERKICRSVSVTKRVHSMKKNTATMLVTLLLSGFFPAATTQAVTLNQTDTFQSGSTDSWAVGIPLSSTPVNVPDAGPTGAGDAALGINSTGNNGPGSRLVAFNTLQWAGDYTAAGIDAIGMDLRNVGSSSLHIRLAADGAGGRFATTTAISLAGLGNWTSAVLSIGPGDWTAVGGTDVNATLASLTQLRVLSAATPAWQGDRLAAELHVDNIRAVPEPATLYLLALAGLSGLWFLRRCPGSVT